MATLNEKFNTLIEADIIDLDMPLSVKNNTNPNFEFRPYQEEALGRFFYYMSDYKKRTKPTHLLFNMATGSGKTLIMASSILYLYEKGYRNFIFFVNSTSIIEKTRDNFLNEVSSKYLLNSTIEIDNKKVKVKEVNNFQAVNKDDINIVFTTIQGLHTTLNNPQENSITYEDFEDKKIVLLADEAHHINALTKSKSLTKDLQSEKVSWEDTINSIFKINVDNVLLEFTATIDLNDTSIAEKYEDKIIYKYSLKEFREDHYSKEVKILSADLESTKRALNALILSQYRLKVAQKHKLFIKPAILMKSKNIQESKDFEHDFGVMVNRLSIEDLEEAKDKSIKGVMKLAFDFFENENISLENLAIEMKEAFSVDKTISVNSKDDSIEKQLIINSLEDENNQVRIIFAVDKLNEGWDVLNLFDIVRLYTTRDGKNGKPGKTTMSEAQLIGRGARYCPFTINGEDKFTRKFDTDIENELRVLEELYYHSAQDSRYISELHNALVETGIKADRTVECEIKVKDSIKATDFWKYGLIFTNQKRENTNDDIFGLEDINIKKLYHYKLRTSSIKSINAMNKLKDQDISNIETKDKTVNLTDLGKLVIKKALAKNMFYRFNNLKKHLPYLRSIEDFISEETYLGQVKIEVTGTEKQLENLTVNDKLLIAIDILNKIKEDILKEDHEFIGTKEFIPQNVSAVFKDKIINVSLGNEQERGVGMRETNNELYSLDLRDKDWYLHTENYGTDQEKLLVRFVNNYISELQNKYEEVYLMRNEKDFYLYSFTGGKKFEPDFVLFLRDKNDSKLTTYQIFIEPKGAHLIETDLWKEEFLQEIENEFEINVHFENKDFKLIGFPFYNDTERREEFNEEFEKIL